MKVSVADCVARGLQTIENLRNVVQAAIDDLEGRKTVVGIANALHQFAYFAAVLVRDTESGGIVARLVDAIARGQPIDRPALEVSRDAQVFLGNHRVHVRLNG